MAVTNLSSVDSSLIHSLDNGRTSTKHHQEVKHGRLAPTVSLFVSQPALLLLREHGNVFESVRSILHASHECTLMEDFAFVGKATSFDEHVDILDNFFFGHPAQGVSQLCRNNA